MTMNHHDERFAQYYENYAVPDRFGRCYVGSSYTDSCSLFMRHLPGGHNRSDLEVLLEFTHFSCDMTIKSIKMGDIILKYPKIAANSDLEKQADDLMKGYIVLGNVLNQVVLEYDIRVHFQNQHASENGAGSEDMINGRPNRSLQKIKLALSGLDSEDIRRYKQSLINHENNIHVAETINESLKLGKKWLRRTIYGSLPRIREKAIQTSTAENIEMKLYHIDNSKKELFECLSRIPSLLGKTTRIANLARAAYGNELAYYERTIGEYETSKRQPSVKRIHLNNARMS